MFPFGDDDDNVTFPPVQKTVGPFVEITGAVGFAFTLTVTEEDVGEVQPLTITETVYVPELFMVIADVVKLFDQVLLLDEDDVRTTLPPEQKVVGPLAVIVGVGGMGLTVTVTGIDGGDVQPPDVLVT